MKGVPRPDSEVARVCQLIETGLSDYEVARRTGVPRSTILNWRHGHGRTAWRPASQSDRCDECGALHSREEPDCRAYSYLLGQYLGDGCIWKSSRTGTCLLRIACEAQYTGIIAECATPSRQSEDGVPHVRYHQDKRLATITS